MGILIQLKSSICTALDKKDISNHETQQLKEIYTLLDILILGKLGKINPKQYNTLYEELKARISRNPESSENPDYDAKLLLHRIKHMDVSQEGWINMKFLEFKLILGGYKNPHTAEVVKLVEKYMKGIPE